MNDQRMRTVGVNDRGQIVIPEDIRNDLKIKNSSTLVLIERDDRIILRKESDVLDDLNKEDAVWRKLAKRSLQRAWNKEDKVWDELYKRHNK